MKTDVSVLHLTNLKSPNIGNAALTLGAERVIRNDLSNCCTLKFDRIAWDDFSFHKREFDDHFIRQVNNSDMLLVAGAVTFNGRKTQKKSGMRFDVSLEQLERIFKPIVFYGVSYRFWEQEGIYPNREILNQVLTILCENESNLIAVRNDGTRNWLNQYIGFKHKRLFEIPDPGLFVFEGIQGSLFPEKNTHPYICVSLNNEDASKRFGSDENTHVYLNLFGEICNYVLNNYDHDIYFVPHSFEDLELIAYLCKKISPINLHQRIRVLGLPNFSQAEEIYAIYRQSELVLSSRVHSMSPSIGMGKKVVTIGTQERLRVYLDNLNLSKFYVNYLDKDSSSTLKNIVARLLKSNETPPDEFKSAVFNERLRVKEFNQMILNLLRLT